MGMATHGLCIGGDIVHAAGVDEDKVVLCCLQVIHHCSLILTLFAAPRAVGQATSSSQGLCGMDALEIHGLWQLHGQDDPEKVDVFQRSPCHLASGPEVLLATPGLLHFIDLSAFKRLVDVTIWQKMEEKSYDPSCFKVGPVGLLVDPSSHLHDVRLLGEGLPPGLLQGLSLLALPVRAFFWCFISVSCLLFVQPHSLQSGCTSVRGAVLACFPLALQHWGFQDTWGRRCWYQPSYLLWPIAGQWLTFPRIVQLRVHH